MEEVSKFRKGIVWAVCRKLGMSRQNYYAGRKQRQRREVDADFVVGVVLQERKIQPRIGVRKLHKVIQPTLNQAGIVMGRDRLYEMLRERGLLVPPLPRLWPRTTHYNPSLPVFRNEIKGMVLQRANEVWVADLTYVRTDEGFLYVSLITDKYSRKIVGYHTEDSLETKGPLKALAHALSQLPKGVKPIHHSDRGCQYCSHEYTNVLQKNGIPISMTEEDHCAENALAERVNGILKQEYALGYGFKTKVLGRTAMKESVHLYNTRRLHSSIKDQVPGVVHSRGTIELS